MKVIIGWMIIAAAFYATMGFFFANEWGWLEVFKLSTGAIMIIGAIMFAATLIMG